MSSTKNYPRGSGNLILIEEGLLGYSYIECSYNEVLLYFIPSILASMDVNIIQNRLIGLPSLQSYSLQLPCFAVNPVCEAPSHEIHDDSESNHSYRNTERRCAMRSVFWNWGVESLPLPQFGRSRWWTQWRRQALSLFLFSEFPKAAWRYAFDLLVLIHLDAHKDLIRVMRHR